MAQLKEQYPDGTVYPTPYHSTSSGPYTKGIHCAGWAALCSDATFGDLPWLRVDRPSRDQLQPGDLVEYKNVESYHVVVVVKRQTNTSASQKVEVITNPCGVDSTFAGGWRRNLIISATPGTRNELQYWYTGAALRVCGTPPAWLCRGPYNA